MNSSSPRSCVFHYLTLLKANKHELNLQQNLKLQSTQDIANWFQFQRNARVATWDNFNSEGMPQWQHEIPPIHQTWRLGMCEHDWGNGMEAPCMLLHLWSHVPGTHQSFFDLNLTLHAPTHLLYCYTMWSPTNMIKTRKTRGELANPQNASMTLCVMLGIYPSSFV